MATRRRKVRWPKDTILQFPSGLNTYLPDDKAQGAMRILENAEGTVVGTWQTRRGRELWRTMPDANEPTMGLYELTLRNGTSIVLAAQHGKLYKDAAGTMTEIPIRLYRPYPPFPDTDGSAGERLNGNPLYPAVERTTGAAAGAFLVSSRLYQWAALAVKGAGKTTLSDPVPHVTSTTAKPVDLVFHGCYKAETYEIWRRESTDGGASYSDWGHMVSGITHVTEGGKTLVKWADDGTIAPVTTTSPPTENTTVHVLPTDQRVDFITWDWEAKDQNAAYFAAGDGICRTDGTVAEIVQPTDPSTYLESGDASNPGTGVNALADVTWPGHTAKGLVRHHAYAFAADVADRPLLAYYTRAVDPSFWGQLNTIAVPDDTGARVLDFGVKEDQLVFLTTTTTWALAGRVFDPFFPDPGVYFRRISSPGVATGWSMAQADNGWLIWLGSDRRIRALVALGTNEETTRVIEIGQGIRPTLDGLTDHANAVAIFADNQYVLAVPEDQKVLRVYVNPGSNGTTTAPVIDTASAFRCLLLRQNQTILGSSATSGTIWTLNTEAYTDGGQSYSMRMKTPLLNLGDPVAPKLIRRMWIHYEMPPEPATIAWTVETDEEAQEGTIAIGRGYDVDEYDEAIYDPWDSPAREIDLGAAGTRAQVQIVVTGYARIVGLSFELDYKNP